MHSQRDCPLSPRLQPRAWQSQDPHPGVMGTRRLGQSLASALCLQRWEEAVKLIDPCFTSPLQLQHPSSPISPSSHSQCSLHRSVSIPKPCPVEGQDFPGCF